MTKPLPSPGLLNWVLLLTLGIVWGTAFLGISLSLDRIGPWWVAAGRVALAALALLLIGPLLGQGVGAVKGPRAWMFSAVIGVATLALPFTLLSWGLTQVPSAFAGVVMGSVPLLVLPLVAIFSPEEGIGPRRVIGVVLGFFGLVALVGPGALEDGSLPGRLACLGAAMCYAVGSILTRRAPAMPPVSFATATLLAGSVALVPLAWLLEGPPHVETASSGLALLYLALIPTGLAAILRVRIITTAGSLFMSLVSYMVPVWAVIFGVTLLDEALPPQLYAALALILGGILISQLRLWQRT